AARGEPAGGRRNAMHQVGVGNAVILIDQRHPLRRAPGMELDEARKGDHALNPCGDHWCGGIEGAALGTAPRHPADAAARRRNGPRPLSHGSPRAGPISGSSLTRLAVCDMLAANPRLEFLTLCPEAEHAPRAIPAPSPRGIASRA